MPAVVINVRDVKPDHIHALMHYDNRLWSLYLVLFDYTKLDLKEMIAELEDVEAYGDMDGILKKLRGLLELNQGKRNGDLISWKDTRGQTTLEEFFEAK